ncbi:hypothetical protein PYCCODRAFT_1472438 [Trametes coccinea BRFM310]|uniref:Uncharacterized protein n=1 Tax=Trametes coccinea (strain BRFM310) TaxID=1353009 RepID=A0A1Y2I6A5_TRAC3|nr:hypothetical protein PYCCODRAFT_1472438 [Trametes coccinea BRFM310]
MVLHAHSLRPASFTFTIDCPTLLLGLWDAPYDPVHPDPDTLALLLAHASGADKWNSLDAKLSAAIYDKIISCGDKRYKIWSKANLDLNSTETELKAKLHSRRVAWESAVGEVCRPDKTTVRDLYLDWGARVAVMLAQEWEQRKQGVESYTGLRQSGQLPWQGMVKDMVVMLAESV